MKAHKMFVDSTVHIRFPFAEHPPSEILRAAISGISDDAATAFIDIQEEMPMFFPTSALNTTLDVQLKQFQDERKLATWQIMLGLPAGLTLSMFRDESFECVLGECAQEFIIHFLKSAADGNAYDAIEEWWQIWHPLPCPDEYHRMHEEIHRHGWSNTTLQWHGWDEWTVAEKELLKRASALASVGL